MDWKPSELPKPTKNLDQARNDIDRWGYCLLEDALPTDIRQRCRYRLEQQAAAEKQRAWASKYGGDMGAPVIRQLSLSTQTMK